MKTSGNTVLITGGATGIGFAMAKELVDAGNTVAVCGRREEKLKEAKSKLPQLSTLVCDVSNEKGQKSLYEWMTSSFPDTNVLINDAGIQRMIDFKNNPLKMLDTESEIDINLKAPVRLSAIFIPQLMKQKEAAIVNVTSALGFVPLAIMPVYCATKAAMHSFTLSLRHQLKDSSVKVFEVIPPR